MVSYFMKKYAMSEKGALNLKKPYFHTRLLI